MHYVLIIMINYLYIIINIINNMIILQIHMCKKSHINIYAGNIVKKT